MTSGAWSLVFSLLLLGCGRIGYDPIVRQSDQTDTDNDTVLDSEEVDGDTDGDGLPNFRDDDDDGDTIPTEVEVREEDEEGGDVDDDGTDAYLDLDSDGDDLSDLDEQAFDLDEDGIPNFLDLDSDGDGTNDDVDATTYCNDGRRNVAETDVDCGGGACNACADDLVCDNPSDCLSQMCTTNRCQAPTCSDGVQNQDEVAVDCGGATCSACPVAEWIRRIGDTSQQRASGVAELNDGIIAAVGSRNDLFVQGLSPTGVSLWELSTPAAGIDAHIAATNDGGFIVAGVTPVAASNVYVAKVDSIQNTAWAFSHNLDFRDAGLAVLQQASGNYLVAGETEPFAGVTSVLAFFVG